VCAALCAFAAEPSKLRSYTREEGGGRLAGPAYYARLDHQGRHVRSKVNYQLTRLRRIGPPRLATGRQLFVKLSYLLRF
jgi:hypothetical protein